jgi:hypothetical protein
MTYWEKKAGLTEAPRPVWRPGEPLPKKAEPTAQQPKAKPLPAYHTITSNPRYSKTSLNDALGALNTPGASERVALFQQFVNQYKTQVVLYDVDGRDLPQFNRVKSALRDQSWADGDMDELRRLTGRVNGSEGYTGRHLNHVVIETTGRSEGPFAINPRILNSQAQSVIDRSNSGQESFAVDVARHRDTHEFLVYLHEMGHQVHYKGGSPNPPANIAGSVTDYGAVNEKEWFAEHFSLWLLDANAYRTVDPVGAQFIEDTLRNALK